MKTVENVIVDEASDGQRLDRWLKKQIGNKINFEKK